MGTKMNTVWHVYYGTRGCAGNYLHTLQSSFKTVGINSWAFVSCYYKFPTKGVVKCFFPITDGFAGRTLIVKVIRAAEFVSAYVFIFFAAVLFRPRISLSLNDDNVVTYMFFRACKAIGLSVDLVCHDVINHDCNLPTRRLKMMTDTNRLIVHSDNAVKVIKNLDFSFGAKIINYPFPYFSSADDIISALDKAAARAKIIEITGGIPFYLFIGVVRPSKGILELLSAWECSSVKDKYKLVIAGKWNNIPNGFKDIADGLKNCIVIDRYLSDEEFTGYIKEASFVVLPYRDYTHSSILFACADQDATVIVSDIPLFMELVPSHPLIFKNGDATDLANKLEIADGMTKEQIGDTKLILNDAIFKQEKSLALAIEGAYK